MGFPFDTHRREMENSNVYILYISSVVFQPSLYMFIYVNTLKMSHYLGYPFHITHSYDNLPSNENSNNNNNFKPPFIKSVSFYTRDTMQSSWETIVTARSIPEAYLCMH